MSKTEHITQHPDEQEACPVELPCFNTVDDRLFYFTWVKGAQIGSAKLWYDKPKKQFYVLVSLEIETPDPTPETHKGIAGVDVGVRYLAVSSNTRGDCSFHAGKSVVPKANHYARLRKRLQQKGTRAATRRLVVISGRERRLKANANHVVSTRIVTRHPNSLIGLEHLTGIRERTPTPETRQARQESDQATEKGECCLLSMVLCRVAKYDCLQGSSALFDGYQGGCQLHEQRLPCLWTYL
jgi:hypothetical protein